MRGDGSSLARDSFSTLMMACWPRTFTSPSSLGLQAAPRAGQRGTGLFDIFGERTLVTRKPLARITDCLSCLLLL